MADYLTVKQVADILCISAVSVRLLIKQGKLKAVKITKEYRISKASLDKFMECIQ